MPFTMKKHNVLAALICFSMALSSASAERPLEEVRFSVWGANIHTRFLSNGTATVSIPVPGAPSGEESRWRTIEGSQIEPGKLGEVYLVPTGLLSTSFILVDDRQGSKLAKWVDGNLTRLNLRRLSLDSQIEAIYRFLGTELRPLRNDFVPGQELDLRSAAMTNSEEFKAQLFKRPVGATPIPLGFTIKPFPVEHYIKLGEGNCIVRSILTSLFLKRLNVNHIVVQGQTLGSGHTWIQLKHKPSEKGPLDERLVDPTFMWHGAMRPDKYGWYFIDQTTVIPYTAFYYLRRK